MKFIFFNTLNLKLCFSVFIYLFISSCTKNVFKPIQKEYQKKTPLLKELTFESEKLSVFPIVIEKSNTKKRNIYYVSNNGSDNNNGLSKFQPIKSIAKVNQLQLLPGDSILFQRGGIWEGQIEIKYSGLANSPIYIGAYDSGTKPILKGSTIEYNWKQYKNNIWYTTRNKLESEYWTVCVFDDVRGVLKYSLNDLKTENNYFVDKDYIYIYSNANPNNAKVEFSRFQHGILIRSQNNIKIEGLDFRYYGYSGIMLREKQDNGNITVNKCNFYFNKMDAVAILNGHNSNLISNCTARFNGNGFYSIRSHNNRFYRDTIEYTISYSDKGMFTDGHGIGLFRSGDCVVEKCFGNSNMGGSIGFDPDADNNVGPFNCIIRYNHFIEAMNRSACIGIQDIAKNSNVFIYYNLIVNESENDTEGFGIYSGFQIEGDLHVYNNTIIQKKGSYRVVAFRYADNVHFKNNLIYNLQDTGSSLEVLFTGIIDSDYNLYYMPNGKTIIKDYSQEFYNLKHWGQKQKVDVNSINKDPKFIDKNYKLSPLSPAINSGVNVGLTKDKDGQPIIGRPDIGCYEFIK